MLAAGVPNDDFLSFRWNSRRPPLTCSSTSGDKTGKEQRSLRSEVPQESLLPKRGIAFPSLFPHPGQESPSRVGRKDWNKMLFPSLIVAFLSEFPMVLAKAPVRVEVRGGGYRPYSWEDQRGFSPLAEADADLEWKGRGCLSKPQPLTRCSTHFWFLALSTEQPNEPFPFLWFPVCRGKQPFSSQ